MSVGVLVFCVFFFKQKTAYEMRISDWSSDVCSSDLARGPDRRAAECAGNPGTFRLDAALRAQADVPRPDPGPVPPRRQALRRARSRWHAGRNPRPGDPRLTPRRHRMRPVGGHGRSEEHTSELKSLMRISYADFCSTQ